jgi:hypothetical protein
MGTGAGLVASDHGTVQTGRCAVCGWPYESVGRGHMLCDGGRTRGLVCLVCVEGGPLRAADRLRRRAARLRLLLERWDAGLSAWGWTGLYQILAESAASLDDLAGRVEQSRAWPGPE